MNAKIVKKLCLMALAIVSTSWTWGQNVLPSDPKMFHLEPTKAPANFKGNIRDLEWLVGNWRTDRSSNSFRDDTYLPLEAGQITGINRAVANGQIAYMNHIVIWQDGDTVKMRHKNSDANMNLRGERDFKLLNRDGDYFYFTGLTLHRVTHDLQEAYFDFGDQKQLQVTKRVQVPNQSLRLLELDTEQELYPEGLAIDALNSTVFLNSTNQNKVVWINFDGKVQNAIENKYHGKLRGTGLFLEKDLLYALGNNNYDTAQDAQHLSVLQIIDTKSNQLLRSYEKTSKNRTLFNDITVASDGFAYITNSSENTIYRINTTKANSRFEEVLKSDEIAGPNGISIAEVHKKLFVATGKGIRIYDLARESLLPYQDSLTAGIDGLKYHDGKLYGLLGNQLIAYQLDERHEAVISTQVILKNHYTFDAPTSLCIIEDIVYVLANSQFGKRARIENDMIDKSQLTKTYLLAVKV